MSNLLKLPVMLAMLSLALKTWPRGNLTGSVCAIALALSVMAQVYGAESLVQDIEVAGGIAEIHGASFPIYPGVAKVAKAETGISYQIPVTSRKEADALGNEIANFYTGKKIGSAFFQTEIRKRVFLDRTTFANDISGVVKGQTDRGPGIRIDATNEGVRVRLTAASPLPPVTYPKGPYIADWDSLATRPIPAWWRDAKFGIWAHWGPECVPEAGDWYGRNIYIQGSEQNKLHVSRYGHPSTFGFKDIINLWKAEKFEPEKLIDLYKRSGARYFVAQAVFHDNFDNWNSKCQPWNAVNMGPKRDIIGAWAAATRKAGLPFGVSVHARSAYTWYEVTRLSDQTGPMKGVPYDGNLTKADGKGLWWEGYDPDDLYAQYGHPVNPYALDRKKAHDNPGDQPCAAFCIKLFNRMQDLISQHHPDLLYFDDFKMPLYGADQFYGLGIAAGLYNDSAAQHGGRNEAVMTGKNLDHFENQRLVNDLEAGREREIQDLPWQTDVCIGNWFYKKGLKYRSADQVVRGIVDVVSKNGNVLLSIPVREDGTIDDNEQVIVDNIGKWFAVNGEAIHGTRPWIAFGEGDSIVEDSEPDRPKGGIFFYRHKAYAPTDFRFTTKGNVLYAVAMAWPENRQLVIRSLAQGAKQIQGAVTSVRLLGHPDPVPFTRTTQGLEVSLPVKKPCEFAFVLKIEGLKWPILRPCQQ
jgi:alpha-L-fucosidase